MKKILLVILFLLIGCASLPRAYTRGSKCIYQVNGLSCKREVVFTPRDRAGIPYHANHTELWFNDLENCKKFINDPRNRDFLNKNESDIDTCGILLAERGSFMVYYVYSDGTTDGNFEYTYKDGQIIRLEEERYTESFGLIFKSKSAFEKYKNSINETNGLERVSIKRLEKIRIKKMD